MLCKLLILCGSDQSSGEMMCERKGKESISPQSSDLGIVLRWSRKEEEHTLPSLQHT